MTRQALKRNAELKSLCPSGKRRFRSEHAAQKALAHDQAWREEGDPRRRKVRYYECDRGCGGWHLTSKPQAQTPRPSLPVQSQRKPLPARSAKTAKPCCVDDCEKAVYLKQMCRAHYDRVRKHGRLDLPSTAERFEKNVERTEGCWLWSGCVTKAGYGRISVDDVEVYAHRLSYEIHVGPIPSGTELDHLCRVRNCVNPAHLEPVTHQENIRRAYSWQTTCANGHPLTEENVRVTRNGGRRCRACNREQLAARRRRAGKPLRPRSIKMQRLYRTERVPLVALMLADNPPCAIQWDANCAGRADTIHELRKRSQGGSITDPANCIPACAYCNVAVEDHPVEAHKRGFVIWRGDVA